MRRIAENPRAMARLSFCVQLLGIPVVFLLFGATLVNIALVVVFVVIAGVRVRWPFNRRLYRFESLLAHGLLAVWLLEKFA